MYILSVLTLALLSFATLLVYINYLNIRSIGEWSKEDHELAQKTFLLLDGPEKEWRKMIKNIKQEEARET